MLLLSSEKEHQPPRQHSIKGSIKKGRLLNGFAKDGCARQVASNAATKEGAASIPET